VAVTSRSPRLGCRLWTAQAGRLVRSHTATVPRALPIPESLQLRPFTVAQAEAAGVPARRLRNAGFRRLARGVYATSDAPDTLDLRCRAALLCMPEGSVISHWSALALLGLAESIGPAVDVSLPPQSSVPRHQLGIRVHQRTVDNEATVVDGIPISGPRRMLVDMAPHLSHRRLVVVGDAVVRRAGSLDRLVQQLDREAGQRHVVAAREAARRVRAGVDSPQETLLRLAIVDAGLPEPQVDVDVRDAAGEWIGYGDLGYRALRIVMQFEGDVHRTNRRRWQQDIARDESFATAGWRVLRATGDDVVRPARFLWRLEQARQQALRDTFGRRPPDEHDENAASK
jgi:very-short-patch-repair endonuclease